MEGRGFVGLVLQSVALAQVSLQGLEVGPGDLEFEACKPERSCMLAAMFKQFGGNTLAEVLRGHADVGDEAPFEVCCIQVSRNKSDELAA